MNQKQSCAEIFAVPRTADALQLYASQTLEALQFGWQGAPLLGHRSSRQRFAAPASLLDIFD